MEGSNMKMRTAVIAALIFAGCYPAKGPAPGPVSPATLQAATTRWPESTSDSLESGRSVFLGSCNKCHGYPDVHKVDEDKWPAVVKRMGKKAKLDQGQEELLLHYILAERAGGSSG